MLNKFIRTSTLALFMMLTTFTLAFPVHYAYATATPLPPPFSKFFYPSSSQFSGQPLAGGQVFTYTAGTTTPLASYTDSTALVQNPNPVILDSNGEANIWIAGAYKIVVEDPNGNVLKTTDNVQDLFTYDFIQSTSTTSLAIQNNATITLTTQAGKYYSPGLYLMIVNTAAPTTNWMHCQVTSYIGTQLMCATDSIGGTGTYASWTISLSGPIGPTGPTGPAGSGAGNMISSINLAQTVGGVSNTATALANLGIGSAGVLNAGTGANQVVQLTAAAKLPAVDGSLLTNLPVQQTPVKAWANFYWNGSAIVINGSLNIASITRSSTGHYIINLTSAVADTGFGINANASGSANIVAVEDSGVSRSASSFGLAVSTPGVFNDSASISVTVLH